MFVVGRSLKLFTNNFNSTVVTKRKYDGSQLTLLIFYTSSGLEEERHLIAKKNKTNCKSKNYTQGYTSLKGVKRCRLHGGNRRGKCDQIAFSIFLCR